MEVNIENSEKPGDGGAHRFSRIVAPQGAGGEKCYISVSNDSVYRFLWVRTVLIPISENRCAGTGKDS